MDAHSTHGRSRNQPAVASSGLRWSAIRSIDFKSLPLPGPLIHRASMRAAIVLAVMPLTVTAVHAQTQRSGGGESQKIMQQYQQLAAEKTALQAEVAQLKKKLESSQTELDAAQKERDALKARTRTSAAAAARLAQANESRQSAEKSLEQNKQRTQELVDRFKLTIGTLKGVEADRDELRRSYDQLNVKYNDCAENNEQLYEITNTVLDRYEHVGFFTKAAAAEPFTRITRTRIDNLIVETRGRAEELRLRKAAPPVQAPSSGRAAPSAPGASSTQTPPTTQTAPSRPPASPAVTESPARAGP